MSHRAWLWLTDFVLLTVILGLNWLAWRHFWYWRFDRYGFDKLMHILGGIFIGLLVTGLWVWWRESRDRPLIKTDLLAWALLAVLAIGGTWEILEWQADKYYGAVFWIKPLFHLTGSWLESVSDLSADLLGALVGISSLSLWLKPKN